MIGAVANDPGAQFPRDELTRILSVHGIDPDVAAPFFAPGAGPPVEDVVAALLSSDETAP